ncbi:hypothetical protein ACN254_002699 [Vibrio cholerae]|nr:hypothetical protein VCSRO205_2038 [Vibrio cholerae]
MARAKKSEESITADYEVNPESWRETQELPSLEFEVNDLLDLVNQSYPKPVTIEKLQQCLDFLFIIGKLELKNETFKAVFR